MANRLHIAFLLSFPSLTTTLLYINIKAALHSVAYTYYTKTL